MQITKLTRFKYNVTPIKKGWSDVKKDGLSPKIEQDVKK